MTDWTPDRYRHGWVPIAGGAVDKPDGKGGKGGKGKGGGGPSGADLKAAQDARVAAATRERVQADVAETGRLIAANGDGGALADRLARAPGALERKQQLAGMSPVELATADAVFARRAKALGKPGQISATHKAIKDEIAHRTVKTKAADADTCKGDTTVADTVSVFAEIVKTAPQPDGSLLVQGKASDSSLDLDQQICDPAWLQRAMPEWFKIGNVREQHDPHRAVGKATEYDARADGHYITAKIVDPVAKAKTEAGIFTGFSIGVKSPRIAKSKAAPNGVIHDGKIVEVSLVDRPANPNASLTLVKAAAPGWEGAAGDLDDERGLVHVEELHLSEDGAAPAAEGMDAEVADAVLGIDTLAAALDIPDADKAAALAMAVEKASQADDIAGARDAIATIGGLIASEAADLVTCPSEAYDIQLLLQAVQALQRFIRCEENEDPRDPDAAADGSAPDVALGARPDLIKGKYSAEQLRTMLREGKATPNAAGEPSYPIGDAEDLGNAISAIGRGGGSHDAIRRYVIGRAKALGLSKQIPDNWQSSGTSKGGAMTKKSAGEHEAPDQEPGQPVTPDGGDPAAEQAQSPSMDGPGDQADPDGPAEKGGNLGKPFGKPGKPEDEGPDDKNGDPAGKKPGGDKPHAEPKPGMKPGAKDDGAKDDGAKEDEEVAGEKKPATVGKAGSPDLVKALTDALGDTDSDLRKTLTAIVEGSMESTAATLDELAGRVEKIEQMAAPGGPALRRTEHDRATARRGDLAVQHEHFKALAANAEDPDLRRGYHTKAAALDAELKAITTALANI